MLQYPSEDAGLSTILLRGAKQLITLHGSPGPRRGNLFNEVTVIPDGSVLIRDGIIVEVGPTRRVENLAASRTAREIDASGRIVMPGFVDSHTHLAFPSDPSDPLDASRKVRNSSSQRMEATARTFLEAMARHGTTTVEAKTGSGTDEIAECKLLRVLSGLQGQPLDVVPSFLCRLPHQNAAAALDSITDVLLPKISRRKSACFADVVCNGDPRLLPLYDRYLQSARSMGFACKLHAATRHTAETVALATRHGAVSIDHLEHASSEDARQIGEAGLTAVLFPISCFHRGSSRPPVRELIEAGAAVALATDFDPQQATTVNMQAAMTLACTHLGLTIEQAISAATINAAYALGRGHRVGSLEPGKLADVVVLNLSHYHDLSNSLGTNVVHQTIKSGKVIYQEGEITRTRGSQPSSIR